MHRIHQTTSVALAAMVLWGCGAGCGGASDPVPTVRTTPAAQRSVQEAGAITVRGDYGPDQHGPYTLHGRYRVRFTQRDAGVDFHAEVPFTAHLEEAVDSGPGRRVPLFQRAAATGTTTVRADGRFSVLIDYADSPYEIVLTSIP